MKMLKVRIQETGELKELTMVDATNGVDMVGDFIGNSGAFIDGQFVLDEEVDDDGLYVCDDTYVCSQETFDWWKRIIREVKTAEEIKNDFTSRIYDKYEYEAAQKIESELYNESFPNDYESILWMTEDTIKKLTAEYL
jgi:hypothetical protein